MIYKMLYDTEHLDSYTYEEYQNVTFNEELMDEMTDE